MDVANKVTTGEIASDMNTIRQFVEQSIDVVYQENNIGTGFYLFAGAWIVSIIDAYRSGQ